MKADSQEKGMKHCMQTRRFVAIVLILFPLLLLPACSGAFTSQQPVIITPVGTGGTPISVMGGGGGQVGGIPCPGATSIQNVDGTAVVYRSIEQQVTKGNALLLSISGDTSQVVGLFQSRGDLNSYISQHDAAHLPLYQQHLYAGPSILVLKQVNQGAYDFIVLQGNTQGGKPNYECRVVGNGQVDSVIQQVSSLHKELQGVQPLELSDYKYTLPTDQIFA